MTYIDKDEKKISTLLKSVLSEAEIKDVDDRLEALGRCLCTPYNLIEMEGKAHVRKTAQAMRDEDKVAILKQMVQDKDEKLHIAARE